MSADSLDPPICDVFGWLMSSHAFQLNKHFYPTAPLRGSRAAASPVHFMTCQPAWLWRVVQVHEPNTPRTKWSTPRSLGITLRQGFQLLWPVLCPKMPGAGLFHLRREWNAALHASGVLRWPTGRPMHGHQGKAAGHVVPRKKNPTLATY